MPEVYSNAALCIAASAATDSHRAIFESANRISPKDFSSGSELRRKLVQLVCHSVKTGVESAIYARSSYESFRADSFSVLRRRSFSGSA
jgi:hypothetical protein